MKHTIINWFNKHNIPYKLTRLQSGNEGIFINYEDREKVLRYCFKQKLLERYEYRANYEKVLLIMKKEG
jgi:hypothetical protein